MSFISKLHVINFQNVTVNVTGTKGSRDYSRLIVISLVFEVVFGLRRNWSRLYVVADTV